MFIGASPTVPENDRLGVLSSTLPVASAAVNVRIDCARIAAVADTWAATPWPENSWDTSLHFFDGTERTLNWMALLDALNFCFWGEPGQSRWRVHWRGTLYNGYAALAAALTRAIVDDGLPITDAGYLAQIDAATLAAILRGEPDDHGNVTPIPLFEARLDHAHELGQVLLDRFSGEFGSVIDAVNSDAVELALLVADAFPSFNDVAIWEGRPVLFLKRAQILVSDIAAAFAGKDPGAIIGIDGLTAFADYRVPQQLRRLGMLDYAADLAERIERLEELAPGEPDEVAIRAGMVWGVELLRRALAERGTLVTCPDIDYRLWLEGQILDIDDHPYHHTRTIYY